MLHPRVLVTIQQYATQNVADGAGCEARTVSTLARRGRYLDVLTLAGGLTDLANRHVIIERHANGEQLSYFVLQ